MLWILRDWKWKESESSKKEKSRKGKWIVSEKKAREGGSKCHQQQPHIECELTKDWKEEEDAKRSPTDRPTRNNCPHCDPTRCTDPTTSPTRSYERHKRWFPRFPQSEDRN